MKASNRGNWSRTFAAALLTGMLMIVGASAAWADEGGGRWSGVLPPGAHPYSLSYPQWAAEWAEWAYSIPTDKSPFPDPDGQFCQVGQSGQVFLRGRHVIHVHDEAPDFGLVSDVTYVLTVDSHH